MRVEPRWLPVQVIIDHNRELVEATSEPHGIIDDTLLESAAARPANHWQYGGQDDLVTLSVLLMLGIAQNHPFLQGNKRTGFVAGIRLLQLNGYTADEGVDRGMGRAIERVLTREATEEWLIDVFRLFIRPYD